MNSYWVEHQARQHVDVLLEEARGDRLAREAVAHDGSASDRNHAAWPWPLQRTFARLEALAKRSRRQLARAR
jgi:hypothetical protein